MTKSKATGKDSFPLDVMRLTHAHIPGDLQFWREWLSRSLYLLTLFDKYIFHLHGKEQLSVLAPILNCGKSPDYAETSMTSYRDYLECRI